MHKVVIEKDFVIPTFSFCALFFTAVGYFVSIIDKEKT